MTTCDVRDLLASSLIKSVKVWGISETTIPTDTVQEINKLGDAGTFLNALGLSPTEDSERIRELASFLESDEAAQAWRFEGRRWRVTGIVNTASEILPKIANSLAIDSSSGRIGRLLRAMPVMAVSQFTTLGDSLSRVLKVEPVPEAMMTAYGESFCKRDETVLAAIDRMIVNDQVLGPVVVELTSRLLRYFGFDGFNLDKKSRESLIDCLVLLVSSALEKVKDWDDKTNS